MSDSEADKLERYLAEKAKQDQEKEQEVEPLSEYEACVLRESAKIHELVAEAQKRVEDEQLSEMQFNRTDVINIFIFDIGQ